MKTCVTIRFVVVMAMALAGCSNHNTEVEAANARAKIAEADAARFKAEAENAKLHQQIATTGSVSNSPASVTPSNSPSTPSSPQNTNSSPTLDESSMEQLRSKMQGIWKDSDDKFSVVIGPNSWSMTDMSEKKVMLSGQWTIKDARTISAKTASGSEVFFMYDATNDVLEGILPFSSIKFKRFQMNIYR